MYGLVHQVDLGYKDDNNQTHLQRLGMPASAGLLPMPRGRTMRLSLDSDTPRSRPRSRRR